MVLIQLNSEKASGNSQDFTTTFSGTINVPPDEGWKIALHSSTIYYSWYNISTEIGNNIIRYSKDSGSTFEPDIVIPDGIYGLSDINTFFQSQLFLRGDYLGAVEDPQYQLSIQPNYNTLRTVLVVLGTYQLDMSAGTLYKLLGVDPQIYTVTSQGLNKVDVNNGVDQLLIDCSIVSGSYSSGISGNALYMFTPSSVPGSALVERPVNLIWLPLNTDTISTIRIRITDQNGNLLNLNNENTNLAVVLEKRP